MTYVEAAMRKAIEGRIKEVGKTLKDYIHEKLPQQQRAEDNQPIDLTGIERAGVVRGDIALATIHLFSARIICKVVPKQWELLLDQVVASLVSSTTAVSVGLRLAKRQPLAKIVIRLSSGLFGLPARLAVQKALEKQIRQQSHELRTQLRIRKLAVKNNRRLVRDVHTRIPRAKFKNHAHAIGCRSR